MSASASLSLCPTCYGSPAFACTPPMQYSFTFPKIEGTTLWEIFLGTPPSWRSGTGSEKGVDLSSPLRVIAEWQLMYSFCALHHARMQMVISPVFGLHPPLELLLPHQAEAYLSTPSWIPFGRRKTGGLHVKAHHNSVSLPQVSLGGSVT